MVSERPSKRAAQPFTPTMRANSRGVARTCAATAAEADAAVTASAAAAWAVRSCSWEASSSEDRLASWACEKQ